MSGGQTEKQVQLIRDFEPDIIMVTPSYMLAILDEFRRQGLDPRATSLRVGVFGAEPWTNAMRAEMEQGLIDADLGGGLVKKRVPLPGRGKSGGARTLVATNKTGRWIFVFGFEKNERDNIEDAELAALQNIAADLLKLDAKDLYAAVASGVLQEICHEG